MTFAILLACVITLSALRLAHAYRIERDDARGSVTFWRDLYVKSERDLYASRQALDTCSQAKRER